MKNASESGNEAEKHRLNHEELKRSLETIDVFIKGVCEKYNLTSAEVLNLLAGEKKPDSVPSYILKDTNLGVLEAVTKYMKEELSLTYHKIAEILKRDDRVVWVTYNKALSKRKERFQSEKPSVDIPVSVFTDEILGPLEAVSKFLIEEMKMEYGDAAKLLNRDPRSIWACYKRANDKI